MSAHPTGRDPARLTAHDGGQDDVLVHGELASMEALKTAIGATLGWRVEIPQMHETVQVLG